MGLEVYGNFEAACSGGLLGLIASLALCRPGSPHNLSDALSPRQRSRGPARVHPALGSKRDFHQFGRPDGVPGGLQPPMILG